MLTLDSAEARRALARCTRLLLQWAEEKPADDDRKPDDDQAQPTEQPAQDDK